jgi:hypothetical protein
MGEAEELQIYSWKVKIFFSIPYPPDWLWGPLSFLYNGYHG